MQAQADPSFSSVVLRYWSKPATPMPFGHLNLRLDGLSGNYFSQGYTPKRRAEAVGLAGSAYHLSPSSVQPGPPSPTIMLELADAAVFEILASNAASPRADLDPKPPGGAFPVIIFDSNLPEQYELGPGAYPVPSLAATRTVVSPSTHPDFECVDWRNPKSHQRSVGLDRSWRVRPKGRGVLKGTVNSTSENARPVVAARKDLSRSAGMLQSFALCFLLTSTSSCCGESSAVAHVPRSLLSRAPFTHAPVDCSHYPVCCFRPDPGRKTSIPSGSGVF